MAEKLKISENSAVESRSMRNNRISETCNGTTMRTRVVPDKTKYTRKEKHKKF